MQAFCRGAGIDPARVPMESEAQSLHLAGRLLREAVIGLKEILRAQQSFRDHYGLESDKPDGRSPLEQGADEYLLELITGHERHQFDAVMQLRGHFTHASEHDSAVDPALRGALGQFMAHLSPKRMESAGWQHQRRNRLGTLQGHLQQPAADHRRGCAASVPRGHRAGLRGSEAQGPELNPPGRSGMS